MVDSTNLPPRTTTSPEWEVRKGNKIYPIETNQLLASLWQSERLKPTDYLRRHGELDWRQADSINWPVFLDAYAARAASSASSSESTSDDVSTEGVETAEVAVDEATLLEEARQAAAALPPQKQPSWWNEDTSARSAASKTKRQLTIAMLLVTTVIVFSVVGMIILLGNLRRPDEQATFQRSAMGSPAPSPIAPESTAAGELEATLENSLQSDANSPAQAESDAGAAIDDWAQSTSDRQNAAAGVQSAELAKSEKPPEPSDHLAAATSLAEVDAANRPAADASLTLAPPSAGSTENLAPSELSEQDLELARMISDAKASIKFYRGTRSQIEEIRKTLTEASNLINIAEKTAGEASARIPQLRAAIKQLELDLPRLKLQANLTGAGSEARLFAQQAQNELANNIKLNQQARSELDSIGITITNCQQQVQAQQLRIQQAFSAMQGVVNHELASLDKYMEIIDFFGEKPLEFHRQLFEETTQCLVEEPDLFYANLLNSASAVRLERFDVPGKNMNQLQIQIKAISDEERTHRQQALKRFAALAQALTGVSHWRQDRPDQGVKLLEQSVRLEPKLAELHLLRAVVGTLTRGVKDGASHFKAASNLAPNDARIHRIRLETLLQTNAAQPTLLRSVLGDLLKVAISQDQRSRMVAAETRLALKEYDLARLYVEKITAPELQDRKAKLLQTLYAQ